MEREIRASRAEERAWPGIHYLWPLNPVVEWLNDKALGSFGLHEAPVVTLDGMLPRDETVFVVSAVISDCRGRVLHQRWFSVVFAGGRFTRTESFVETIDRTGLGRGSPSGGGGAIDLGPLTRLLPEAVDAVRRQIETLNVEDPPHLQVIAVLRG
jgi:hypothetical protein